MTHVFHGCDVSHHQTDSPKPSSFNWPATVQMGATFGACKVTEGERFVDSAWHANRAGMAAAGLRWRGLYAWISPDHTAAAHVALFKSLVGSLNTGEFVMLDIEQHPLTEAQIVAALEAFEAAYPGRVVRYQGLYFPFGREGESPLFARWPWIIAYYSASLPTLAEQPVVWQWAGGAGGVVIDGYHIDSNTVLDPAALDRVCALAPQPSTPTEEPDVFEGFVKDDSAGHFWARGIDYDAARGAGQEWQPWACLIQEIHVPWELYQVELKAVPIATLEAVHRVPVWYAPAPVVNVAPSAVDAVAIAAAVVEAVRQFESRP